MIDVPPAIVVFGLITGLTYGVLAVGLLLAYRSSGVINFAHGNVGGLAAAVLGRLSINIGFPWLVAFPIAILAGAGAAALLEVTVIRRLRGAPRVMAIVATLGAAQLLLGLAGAITKVGNTTLIAPPFNLRFSVGSLVVTPYYVLTLIFSPIVIGALVLFLSPPSWLPRRLRSRYGPAMRAAADNPDAARTVGISTDAMSTMAWAIAGALAAFGAVLVAPSRGFQTIDALGPDLLVRALAPAVVAGMANLPIAMGAGVVIGVFEQITTWNTAGQAGIVDLGLFVLIVAGLLLRRRADETSADTSWLTLPVERPLPEHLRRIWTVRNLNRIATVVALAVLVLLPVFLSNSAASTFVTIFTLATIGLSITLVTGISGQISLGQFALAGIGALASYVVFIRLDTPWPFALAAGAAAGALASLVIGLPALRLRGLLLAVTSLSFAVMAPTFIFASSWGFAEGVEPGRPIIGSSEVLTDRAYYYIALIALVVCAWLVRNVRAGGLGRVFSAIRDFEDGARAFGIGATARKLQSFALSGAIAGLGGVIFAEAIARVTAEAFPPIRSVTLLAMVVLGGLGRVSGAVLGAAYLVGLPGLINVDTVQLMVSGVGVLVFVLYVPGGLSQLLDWVRAAIVRRLARSSAEPPAAGVATPALKATPVTTRGAVLLEAEGLTVEYGHVKALDGMSLVVREGETVGIIGPNGSGKTTLFKVLSGFVRSSGRVVLAGRDVSSLRPESRARLGLVRSFQDSMLFPTLTVEEAVRLALERQRHTRFVSSVVSSPWALRSEREKGRTARELMELLGLAPFREKLVGELSTGTRRIAEMCCLLALQPRLLLLDEPSSGIAQKETEALRELLVAIKARLNTTLVVIEHDMPLIMSISDRVVAMASGSVVAEGTPAEVQRDDRVVESYLGAT